MDKVCQTVIGQDDWDQEEVSDHEKLIPSAKMDKKGIKMERNLDILKERRKKTS